MSDLDLLRARFTECVERGMFSYDGMTVESVMSAVRALPRETSDYLVVCMTGITETYRRLDHTFDGMIARMLHNGSSVQSLEDAAFLRARTDVAWEVYDDWKEDPDEEDWFNGTKALRLNMLALTRHKLQGFGYDPSTSIRRHDEHTRSQCAALFNLAVEINAAMETATQRDWQGWTGSTDHISATPLFIADVEVSRIVVDSPSSVDAIVEFIGINGYDPEQLVTVFGHGMAISLIDGAL